jgi:hypothetical protein
MSFFQKQRTGRQNRACVGVGTRGRGRMQGKGVGGEYGGNIVYTCTEVEK